MTSPSSAPLNVAPDGTIGRVTVEVGSGLILGSSAMTPADDIIDSLRAGPMSVRQLREDTGRDAGELTAALEQLAADGQILPAGRWRWRLPRPQAAAPTYPERDTMRRRVLVALRRHAEATAMPAKSEDLVRGTGLTLRQVRSALAGLAMARLVVALGKRWLLTAAGARP